eukprot:gene25545-25920_t
MRIATWNEQRASPSGGIPLAPDSSGRSPVVTCEAPPETFYELGGDPGGNDTYTPDIRYSLSLTPHPGNTGANLLAPGGLDSDGQQSANMQQLPPIPRAGLSNCLRDLSATCPQLQSYAHCAVPGRSSGTDAEPAPATAPLPRAWAVVEAPTAADPADGDQELECGAAIVARPGRRSVISLDRGDGTEPLVPAPVNLVGMSPLGTAQPAALACDLTKGAHIVSPVASTMIMRLKLPPG